MQEVSVLKKNCMGLLLLACLLGAAAVTGCTEAPGGPGAPSPEATPVDHATYTPTGPQPSFSTVVTASEKRFRADTSCYWIVTGAVTNAGTAPARNVVIRFILIDDESDTIRSTETIFVPRFPAGETKIFTIDPLPGDCDRQYRAEISVARDVP